MPERLRLDTLLVEKNFFSTRSRARDAIARGTVTINGVVVKKAGQAVLESADIGVFDPAQHYVSRAALKLIAALSYFPVKTEGVTALDIGASTGGFTEVLLEKGASHVIAVDVGHGQLHPSLIGHPAITLYEGLNARDLEKAHLKNRQVQLVVSDVSFISLKLALPPALSLAESGAQAVLLVKPQFEIGREGLGRGGIVKDPSRAESVARELFNWLDGLDNWRAKGLIASPIEGGDGNREYLLFGEKSND